MLGNKTSSWAFGLLFVQWRMNTSYHEAIEKDLELLINDDINFNVEMLNNDNSSTNNLVLPNKYNKPLYIGYKFLSDRS